MNFAHFFAGNLLKLLIFEFFYFSCFVSNFSSSLATIGYQTKLVDAMSICSSSHRGYLLGGELPLFWEEGESKSSVPWKKREEKEERKRKKKEKKRKKRKEKKKKKRESLPSLSSFSLHRLPLSLSKRFNFLFILSL